MRRWLRILVVGALTIVLAIDSASACRLFRSRCRPRCRVVTCRVVRPLHARRANVCQTVAVYRPGAVVEVDPVSGCPVPEQCCVPADGSAHAVIEESVAPIAAAPLTPAPSATPQPISPPQPALEPVAPASAEQPLPLVPPATPEPAFKTAAEILAESAERDRAEKAASEAAAKSAPPAEPPMVKPRPSTPAPVAEPETPPAPTPPPAPLEPAPEPAPEKPMAKEASAPEQPEPEPKPEPEPSPEPKPKPAEENLFDEDGDAPAERKPADKTPRPVKKPAESADDASGNLFDESDETPPAKDAERTPAKDADEPADDPEPEPAKTDDDPFAGVLEAPAEPVRRWIDDTGRHETIGRLVEIRPDGVRILKSNGRCTTVPMRRLSRHDQAYVSATGERLAAQRPALPAVTDTARR